MKSKAITSGWLRYLLDLLVVVVGIVIAFQLDSRHQAHTDAALLASHYEGLADEISYNRGALQQAEAMASRNRDLADTIMYLVRSGSTDVDAFNRFTYQLLNLGGVYIKRNAYQTLVTSGDIRLIKDFERKDHIIRLYEYYEWVKSMDNINLDSYQRYFYPWVMAHQNMSNGAPATLEEYRSREYFNAVASYYYHLNSRIERYQECQKMLETFVAEGLLPEVDTLAPPAAKPATAR